VRHQKLIAFLVGLCVLLAPVLSSASMPLPVSSAQVQVQFQDPAHAHQDHEADCHPAKSADDHHPISKVSHGCCFSFVGNFSATLLIPPYQSASELIPFNPAFSLASRIEGLFRPPRQNS
jgi:hypothetical protein